MGQMMRDGFDLAQLESHLLHGGGPRSLLDEDTRKFLTNPERCQYIVR
jgi:hypothetical protein